MTAHLDSLNFLLSNERIRLSLAKSESENCINSANWSFIDYGSKACGGPIGYIAYSNKINTSDFLNKISVHKSLQNTYNSKYEVISTCDIPPAPSKVSCVNGEAVLIY